MEYVGEPHLGRATLTAQWEPAPSFSSFCAPPCPSCSQCVPRASSLPPSMLACKGRPKPFPPQKKQLGRHCLQEQAVASSQVQGGSR